MCYLDLPLIDAHVHIFPEIYGYGPKGIIRGLDGAACVVLKAEDIDAAAIQGVLELKHRYFVMEGKG